MLHVKSFLSDDLNIHIEFNLVLVSLKVTLVLFQSSFNDFLHIWTKTCGCLELYIGKTLHFNFENTSRIKLRPTIVLIITEQYNYNCYMWKVSFWRRLENTYRDQTSIITISMLHNFLLVWAKTGGCFKLYTIKTLYFNLENTSRTKLRFTYLSIIHKRYYY